MKFTCKVFAFFIVDFCFNYIMYLNKIIVLRNNFKIRDFIIFAVKYFYNIGILLTRTAVSAAYHNCILVNTLQKSFAVISFCRFPHFYFKIFYHMYTSDKIYKHFISPDFVIIYHILAQKILFQANKAMFPPPFNYSSTNKTRSMLFPKSPA